jgi:hypothetical protein
MTLWAKYSHKVSPIPECDVVTLTSDHDRTMRVMSRRIQRMAAHDPFRAQFIAALGMATGVLPR